VGPIAKSQEVQRAAEDLRLRTLAKIPRVLDRFIYLASTRDYNTGLYHHEGLASRFSPEVACEALADCHREAYHELLLCPLEELVKQMEAYIESSQTPPHEFLSAWKELEPYRVTIPMVSEAFSADFLFSNFKVALAIVEDRLETPRRSREVA
jgi:hypothetical protein